MKFEFKKEKKEKVKVMLAMEAELLDDIEGVKPITMSVQECIRQIVRFHVEELKKRGV